MTKLRESKKFHITFRKQKKKFQKTAKTESPLYHLDNSSQANRIRVATMHPIIPAQASLISILSHVTRHPMCLDKPHVGF